jgi:UDP-3-O-[3-hydroxymyristoyl] glucosamine N-acyltransferase
LKAIVSILIVGEARDFDSENITEKNKQWSGFPAMEHRKWLRLQGTIAQLVE